MSLGPSGSTNERGIVPNLSGVPETMLWPLYNRAIDARRPDAQLDDPLAVQIFDAIDYDYARSFGRPDDSHVVRALLIDGLLRDWLAKYPNGQIVALGEGLETQFCRVDNGQLRWLSVDLPEAIEIRDRFLPDIDRHRNFACSALDFRWMNEIDIHQPVFITAAGLLMYLKPDEVRQLITTIAQRCTNAEMIFDVIPRFFSYLTMKGTKKTPHYVLPAMPWGMDRNELVTIKSWHPNIAELHEIPFSGGRGFFFGVFVPFFRRLPWLGNKIFSMVHLRFRSKSP